MKEYDSMEGEVGQPTTATMETLGKYALRTIFLASLVLIVGMVMDKQRVGLAVTVGIGFFTLFGGMVILVLSGQLALIVNHYQSEKTVRLQQERQYQLYAQPVPELSIVAPAQLGEGTPSLPASNFVPAVPTVEEGIKVGAYDFVMELFQSDGTPDPKRVLPETSAAPDKIQRKKPRQEVLEYLMALGLVEEREGKMIYFNTKNCPTLQEAKLSIKRNVPVGRKAEV